MKSASLWSAASLVIWFIKIYAGVSQSGTKSCHMGKEAEGLPLLIVP